jgi:putative membrane protein
MHRRILFATAAAASLVLVAACGQQEGAAPDQQNQPVNAAQDAASAVVGPTSAATLGSTTVGGFVSSAAIGDMYEIESSRMALERATSAEVKALAQMLIDEHTAASNQLKTLVSGGQVPDATLPTTLDERRQGLIDNLRGAPDAEFDDRYLDQQANAHREMLVLLNGYQTAGQNEPLKAFAAEMEPKIKAHLDRVVALDSAR